MALVELAGGVAVHGRAPLGRQLDRRVLAALALVTHPSKALLVEVGWDGKPPATFETALRGSLSRIRRMLAEVGVADAVRGEASGFVLRVEVTVDVVEARAALTLAETASHHGDLDACPQLLTPLLPTFDAEFAAGEEGAWFDEQRRIHGLHARQARLLLADAAAGQGRWRDVITACEPLAAQDPLDESAARRLIAAYAAADDRAAALRTYERCRAALAEELGASPSPATEDTYLAALGALDGPLLHDPAALVRHLLDIGSSEATTRAVAPAITAAEVLADRGSHAAAVELLEGVGDRLAERSPTARSERARVLCALMVTRVMTNDVAPAREELRAAGELALAAGDPGALVGLAGALRAPSAPGLDEEMVDLVERLLALAPAGTASRVVLLTWLSHELARSEHADRSVVLAREAVDGARQIDNPELLRSALQTWHVNAYAYEPPNVRATVMREAIVAGEREPRRLLDGLSRLYLAADLVDAGDAAGAADEVHRALGVGLGPPVLRWVGARSQAMLAVALGEWDRAEELINRAEALATEQGSPETLLITFTQRSAVAYHRGGLEPYRDLAVAFAKDLGGPPLLLAAAAQLDAELGGTSAGVVERAVDVVLAMPRWMTLWASTGFVAEAVARSSDVEPSILERLALVLGERSGSHASIPLTAYLGPVDRYLGLLRRTADPVAAAGYFTAAADQCRSFGSGPMLARTLLDHAELIAGAGPDHRLGSVAPLVDEAANLVDRFSLEPLRRRLAVLTTGT